MSAQLATYGRLDCGLRSHETNSGVSMTTPATAVCVEARGGNEGEQGTLWRRLLDFARQPDDLAGHRQSDLLSPSGRLQLWRYTASASEVRDGWQAIIDSVVSSRINYPGGGRCTGGDGGRRAFPAARDDGHHVNAPTHSLMALSGSEAGR